MCAQRRDTPGEPAGHRPPKTGRRALRGGTGVWGNLVDEAEAPKRSRSHSKHRLKARVRDTLGPGTGEGGKTEAVFQGLRVMGESLKQNIETMRR